MSYSSPKVKRFTGKIGSKPTEKTDSPKKTTRDKRKSIKLNSSAVPGRVREMRARSPARTTLSFTIQNRDSDVDGFSITAYLPQSGWKKLKVLNYQYTQCHCIFNIHSYYRSVNRSTRFFTNSGSSPCVDS